MPRKDRRFTCADVARIRANNAIGCDREFLVDLISFVAGLPFITPVIAYALDILAYAVENSDMNPEEAMRNFIDLGM